MPDFEDPFKSPESTVLRPRPGAGRRGAGEPAPQQQRPLPGAPQAEAVSAAAMEGLGVGLSPLVRAASPLLLLTGQLRGTLAGPDIPTLRRHALDEIRRFEDRARAGGVQNEVVLAARYALCAGLDEAVLSTPWGAQSEWGQQTLLVALHREAWGGEKFFEMLDRISADPKRHIDLMELQYLCLAFGFAGKYQVADRGHARLSDIQHDLYRRIRDYRGAPPAELSLRWKGLQDRRNPVIRYVPWWVVGAAALAIVVIAYTVYLVKLGTAAAPVHEHLYQLGNTAQKIPEAPPGAKTLESLLGPEIASGRLTVEKDGGRTIVIVAAGSMFASGSATVSAEYLETLNAIARALAQVPGRTQVLGFTDNRPVRSIKYPSNVELSSDRARSVAAILTSQVPKTMRIDALGRGENSPRYPPASDPRNRRVEIVHERVY